MWPRRPNPLLGALTGALAVQVVLRWPAVGFHGATALVAVAATAPCLVGAVRTLSAPARRRVRRWTIGLIALAIVLSIPAAVTALLARSEISQGIATSEGALGSIGNGTTGYGAAQLQSASADFASAASSTDSWWTAGARLVPVVSQQRQAVGQASAVARDVTATAASQASGVNYQELRYSDGQLNLDRVSALAGPLDVVDNQLTGAVAQLRSLQSGWLRPAGAVPPGRAGHQGLRGPGQRLAGRAAGAGRARPARGRRRPPLLHRLHGHRREPRPRRA